MPSMAMAMRAVGVQRSIRHASGSASNSAIGKSGRSSTTAAIEGAAAHCSRPSVSTSGR
jgi:hypothetical protein